MESTRTRDQIKTLRIASRSKHINGVLHEAAVIVISHSDLERYFSSPLHEAALYLGVCTTTLKW